MLDRYRCQTIVRYRCQTIVRYRCQIQILDRYRRQTIVSDTDVRRLSDTDVDRCRRQTIFRYMSDRCKRQTIVSDTDVRQVCQIQMSDDCQIQMSDRYRRFRIVVHLNLWHRTILQTRTIRECKGMSKDFDTFYITKLLQHLDHTYCTSVT